MSCHLLHRRVEFLERTPRMQFKVQPRTETKQIKTHNASSGMRLSQTFPPHESKPTFPLHVSRTVSCPFCTTNPHSLHAVSTTSRKEERQRCSRAATTDKLRCQINARKHPTARHSFPSHRHHKRCREAPHPKNPPHSQHCAPPCLTEPTDAHCKIVPPW